MAKSEVGSFLRTLSRSTRSGSHYSNSSKTLSKKAQQLRLQNSASTDLDDNQKTPLLLDPARISKTELRKSGGGTMLEEKDQQIRRVSTEKENVNRADSMREKLLQQYGVKHH